MKLYELGEASSTSVHIYINTCITNIGWGPKPLYRDATCEFSNHLKKYKVHGVKCCTKQHEWPQQIKIHTLTSTNSISIYLHIQLKKLLYANCMYTKHAYLDVLQENLTRVQIAGIQFNSHLSLSLTHYQLGNRWETHNWSQSFVQTKKKSSSEVPVSLVLGFSKLLYTRQVTVKILEYRLPQRSPFLKSCGINLKMFILCMHSIFKNIPLHIGHFTFCMLPNSLMLDSPLFSTNFLSSPPISSPSTHKSWKWLWINHAFTLKCWLINEYWYAVDVLCIILHIAKSFPIWC